MTKRREIIKMIDKAAKAKGLDWAVARQGANHTVFDLDGVMIPIARHNEIDNRMAEIIFKECADKLGKDWWK
ncbi:MAG: hypothetical protein ABIQ09_03110 [Jatrophihabitantaceae bacterium]